MGRARGIALVLLALCALAPVRPASALNITFDYSLDAGGLFTTSPQASAAVAALDAAAAYFEAFLDDLDAITPGGGNTWTARFTSSAMRTSSTSVSCVSANDAGHMLPSSRLASTSAASAIGVVSMFTT